MAYARTVLRRLAQHGVIDDPEVAAHLSVGLDNFLQRWKRETLDFLAAGGSELRFVAGGYGRGKTHFLLVLERLARREGFVVARVDASEQPFASLEKTYCHIAAAMSPPDADDDDQRGVDRLLGELDLRRLNAYRESGRGNPGFANLVYAYAKRVQKGDEDGEVTEDLRALLMHDKGRRVTFGALYRMDRDLPRPLAKLGKRNAALWLRSLLTLPRQLGFKGLVVLFDETGADLHLARKNSRERQGHMANLRNLVDHLAAGAIPGCSVVYATTRDFLDLARQEYEALWQRVARMERPTPFSDSPPNPRAVWCALDELTDPNPAEAGFFHALGEKLLELAAEAEIPAARIDDLRGELRELGEGMSRKMQQGVVREFVKRAAAKISPHLRP